MRSPTPSIVTLPVAPSRCAPPLTTRVTETNGADIPVGMSARAAAWNVMVRYVPGCSGVLIEVLHEISRVPSTSSRVAGLLALPGGPGTSAPTDGVIVWSPTWITTSPPIGSPDWPAQAVSSARSQRMPASYQYSRGGTL